MSDGLGSGAGTGTSPTAQGASTNPATAAGQTPSSSNTLQNAPQPNFKGTKHKVKIDGQEREVDYDELVTDYQTRKAAMQRFNDAKKLADESRDKTSRLEQIEQALEKGDIKFLIDKLGRDKANELFENHLISEMEYKQLSPAERRAIELEEENKQLRKKDEDAAKAAEADRKAAIAKQAHAQLDSEIKETLAGLGRKPTPRMALRVVDEMIIAREGKKEISAKDAAGRALKRIHGDITEYLPGLSIDELRQVIPQTVIDQLREDEVKRVTSDLGQKRPARKQDGTFTKGQPKPANIDDWFEQKQKRLK